MVTAQQLNSSFRSFLAKAVALFITLYAIALTCSMAAMEIASWATAFFFCLYVTLDRRSKGRKVEIHTVGVELPMALLIITVICGLKINAPDGDFWFAAGSLRNLALLFFFAYAFQVSKNLNRLFFLLVTCGTIISIYGIWQHFTGIDLWRHSSRALMGVPWGDHTAYSTVGFFSHHLTYGHSYMMILCVPWAALLLGRHRRWWEILGFLISFGLLLTSLIFTYGRGVWIAILVGLPVMAFFASRKLFFISFALLLVGAGILYKSDPLIRERAMSIISDNYTSNDERRKLWQANMEMFHDHPWIGVGYRQNEPLSQEYYKKLDIKEGMSGHAHSNYVELLATTGMLGFGSYMLIILGFILMTARLYSSIPVTHYWHRVFALAALGAQIAFHVGGLTQWNFGDAEVQHQFIFWLAVVAYMSQRYYAHIVPDDNSL